ncbi:pendrin-like [Amia ocellicauda]|uniref:pendrin-like n=1 Tax=Amia ocellicauda TaxID=2972642 RepID=UPI003464059A
MDRPMLFGPRGFGGLACGSCSPSSWVAAPYSRNGHGGDGHRAEEQAQRDWEKRRREGSGGLYLIVLIFMLALGPLLQPLQKSVLGAIVMANLKGMFMQVLEVPRLWKQNKTDSIIWVFTCIACIILGLDIGLLGGVVFEMATVVVRTQFPSCSALANVPGTDLYKNICFCICEEPGIKIFKCNSPIYFANIDFFRDRLKAIVGVDAVRVHKKRTKALKQIQRLIKKGRLRATKNGMVSTTGIDNNVFEQDKDTEKVEDSDIPSTQVDIQVDWNADLPVKVAVPKVHIHSLILDFSATSFLDVVSVKSLKLVCI